MNSSAWEEVVVALESREADIAVAAAERLRAEATPDDVPKLLGLLQTGRDFFVREAAAWPLAELSGPSVLRELFLAY